MERLGMKQNKTNIIGITGGIGSGKSTVAKLLAENLSSVLIDADKLSREVMTGEDIKEQIKLNISPDVFDENNILDRKKLADIIFNDDKMRNKLNEIVHPLVRELFWERVNENQNADFIIYDCPLLIEAGLTEDVDCIVIVYLDYETQIQRVMIRDKCSRDVAVSKINAQMDMDDKIKFGDFVIYNDSGIDELKKSIEFVGTFLRQSCI